MRIMANPKIVLLDDDREFTDLLTEYLSGDGFDVFATADPARGLHEADAGRCNLLLLDVMLGAINGFDVLRRVRAQTDLPVIMLTARGDDMDRILGLELGADDYVPKPFHPRELAARIRAILRRVQHGETPAARAQQPFVIDDLRIEPASRRVLRNNQPVQLTGVEFSLLELLARASGQLITREELFRRVLGREIVPFDRSIDMHVSNLRRKLGRSVGGVERIQSIRGVGYIFAVAGDPPPAAGVS